VHEIESLYCLRGVVTAVARHLGILAEAAEILYNKFVGKVRSQISNSLMTKQIAERCKLRVEPAILGRIAGLRGADDVALFEAEAIKHLDPATWAIDAQAVLAEEKKRVSDAIVGPESDLLRVLPGKPFLAIAAHALGLETATYRAIVENALQSREPALQELRRVLEAALVPHLPPTQHVDAV